MLFQTRCFNSVFAFKKIIIPSSVTLVESDFILYHDPDSVTFCGTKDPKFNSIYGFGSMSYTKKVIVPNDYEGTKFLGKEIEKTALTCVLSNIKKNSCLCRSKVRRSLFDNSNFFVVFLLAGS